MHATKKLTGDLSVSLELGKPGGKNPDHVCNVHLVLTLTDTASLFGVKTSKQVSTIARIRGISVYKKERNGRKEWVLRCPGYRKGRDSKYETAYLQLSDEIKNFIYETLENVSSAEYVSRYSGQDNWSIWSSGARTKEPTL